MISYAQNAEDVRLNRVFACNHKGFYIDIGAADPVVDSVTKFFYEKGWHGINVEPVAGFLAKLRSDRDRDVNLGLAVSNYEGTRLFYEGPEGYGGSTFEVEVAEQQRREGVELQEVPIPVTTLARLFEQHVDCHIDFLKIDVEGHEREVLEGANWERWRPVVVVIEATVPHTALPSHDQWEKLLLSADYCFAASDGLNRFYVRREDRELIEILSVPVNYLDNYEPYRYKQLVDNLGERVGTLTVENSDLDARTSAAERAKAEAWEKFETARSQLQVARDELGALNVALTETRRQLAVTQRGLNDVRIQLEASQSGLISTVSELASVRHEHDVMAHAYQELRKAQEKGVMPAVRALVRRVAAVLRAP